MIKTQNIILVLCLVCGGSSMLASIDTATTGSWDEASTWQSTTVPASGDTLLIPGGVTVTVECNCGTYADMHIVIYGDLVFPGGQKISMTANGVIDVYSSGSISGFNPGDKIIIDGNTVWRGNDPPITGPSSCYSTGCGSNSTLPIDLLYFRLQSESGKALLEWATTTETNNDYFSIWRSSDLDTWKVIGTIGGAGHSSQRLEYQFLDDRSSTSGTMYYRLQQTDFDGTNAFVGEVLRHTDTQQQHGPALNIYPNPVLDFATISMEAGTEPESISILDMEGSSRLYFSPPPHDNSTYEIDLQSLEPGAYILEVVMEMNQVHHQVILVE